MLFFLIFLLVPGEAQDFEVTNENAKVLTQRSHQNRQIVERSPTTIPDIVIERNGDSQFNSGPLSLPSSRNHKHKRDKKVRVQSTTSVQNGLEGVFKINRSKNNRRLNLTSTSNQRKNLVPKEKQNIRTNDRGIPHERHFPIEPVHEEKKVQVDQFDEEYEDENVEESSQGSIARTENRAFQDIPSLDTFVGFVDRHNSYAFPEKQHPLKQCFYNPSGYACCNRNLNDEIVRTYEQLASDPTYNPCNIQKLANLLQRNCSRRFKMRFETIVGLNDYAQRVNFRNDLVCKVELAGRYMLAYATPQQGGSRARRDDPVVQVEGSSSEGLLAAESSTTHSLLI